MRISETYLPELQSNAPREGLPHQSDVFSILHKFPNYHCVMGTNNGLNPEFSRELSWMFFSVMTVCRIETPPAKTGNHKNFYHTRHRSAQ